MTRKAWFKLAAVIVALGLALAAPKIAWHLQRPRVLEVVVVDKTVPFRNFREHAAIPWILHALKLKDRRGAFLDPAVDYVGFDPDTRKGTDLTSARLASADALVVTDTYGVYTGDYEKPGDVAALERSPKIYGGVSADEATAIEAFAGRGGLIVAEFNTFASPTDAEVRARMEALFGARWTGWVARYWPNLADENEVPRWVGRVYRRITGKDFDFRGGGMVFVREDRDIVVLTDGSDLGADVVRQVRTPLGAVFDFPVRGGFWFWMDVVEPTDGEVLAEHEVDATEAGAKKLAEHGLARRFPALVRRRSAWYLAGDFVDNAIELGDPEQAWLFETKRRGQGCGRTKTTDETFFWGWYVPVVARLFSAHAHPDG